MNTTGYTGGSKKLLAISRKKGTLFVKIEVGLPTTSEIKEGYPYG
ncbi:hypothetical protein [Clostridium sulfidigenes]|nr:hypothetical protein [Clostridium sulfidigenes]